jgi:hypothetical protein
MGTAGGERRLLLTGRFLKGLGFFNLPLNPAAGRAFYSYYNSFWILSRKTPKGLILTLPVFGV